MTAGLKLDLDGAKPRRPDRSGLIVLLLAVAIALGAAGLVLHLRGARSGPGPAAGGLRPAELEALALKLERQGLAGQAAGAWLDYLAAAAPGRNESARVWYRIGKLRQDGGDCAGALEAFYRSEAAAPLPELEREISLRTADCLGRLGRFAARRDEIAARIAVAGHGNDTGAEVLAEIGPWKITRAELIAMIEAEIEAQLRQAAGDEPAERLRERKEQLLDEVLRQGNLAEYLERFVAEELLYRYAVESGMHEDPALRELTRRVERSLLAAAALDREYAGAVSVGEDEMRAWYEANRGRLGDGGEGSSYAEAREQVYAAVKLEKQMRVQARLLDELRRRYDVVIHRTALGARGATEE